MKKSLSLAALSAAMLSAPLVSQAVDITRDFNVTLTLTPSCTIDTAAMADLAFGTQTSAAVVAGPIDANTTVDVTCSFGADYTVDLNNGLNSASATGTNRAMLGGAASYVSYELYSDSYTTTWDSGSPVAREGTGAQETITVYGRIPAQTPDIDSGDTFDSAGLSFQDTVTLTLSY
ncbi:spore coat U domain-containing protein [Alcanivorax sp. S6407]|uniref:Csu type fimbrial protein n=1 Tax=Alcanivorax sp. S6407 TaxID=2926424 RepID=UPI001FF1223E|nr:spore coat U domain-containing protein [Alcanivorax sp. S6407]MCK0155162.1 spore coat U domain-containing protein [Alcanivorax sp. S6407]